MWRKFKRFLDCLTQLLEALTELAKGTMAGRSRPNQVIQIFLPLFDLKNANGVLDITTGVNEIEISTGVQPKKVWFSFDDLTDSNSGTPVCAGDIDRIGITLSECGFIIHANIISNSRTLRWFAML